MQKYRVCTANIGINFSVVRVLNNIFLAEKRSAIVAGRIRFGCRLGSTTLRAIVLLLRASDNSMQASTRLVRCKYSCFWNRTRSGSLFILPDLSGSTYFVK